MKTRVFADYGELCSGVADQVAQQLHHKPNSTLVFPTGNTPLGLFKRLVEMHRSARVNFASAHVVVLDEYLGLSSGDSRSLTDWLKRELLTPLGLSEDRIFGFENGPEALEKKIAALGGIDLVVLGLGPNGHLGFNEPGSAFDSRTRKVDLAPESIVSNAAYWGSEDRVPRQGVTLGLGTLKEAQSIVLMVSGASKQRILKSTLNDPVSPANPATLLRELPQTVVYADKAALQV